VFCNKDLEQWLDKIKHIFPQLSTIELTDNIENQTFRTICPWGWDDAIKNKLISFGLNSEIFLQQDRLTKIRELSNRTLAIVGLQYLIKNIGFLDCFPNTPIILTNIDEVVDFANKNAGIIFKAPWSGSGKGLRWVRAGLTDSHKGWCKNTLLAQGSLIAEKIYDKIQDFAMEFECKNGTTQFAGYSLFETENGIYRNNFLTIDKKIEEILAAKGLDTEMLNKVQDNLIDFFNISVSPNYSGPLGVDMFIYLENGNVKLHPCVEINLRMTMGYLARIFYDRFVSDDKEGRFYVDHFATKGDLLKDHLRRKNDFPLKTHSSRITQGYISLNNIDENTCYRVRVEVG
ncbi:MAG: hypothetical protein PHE56_10830, partial [Bacteroidales bacterium]|nr:hypothetical protein [Bacteroidales bacterium]